MQHPVGWNVENFWGGPLEIQPFSSTRLAGIFINFGGLLKICPVSWFTRSTRLAEILGALWKFDRLAAPGRQEFLLILGAC